MATASIAETGRGRGPLAGADPRWRRVGPLGRLTAGALVGMAVLFVYYVVGRAAEPNWSLLPFAAPPLAFAGLVLAGFRPAPLLGPVMAGVVVSFLRTDIPYDLARPEDTGHLAYTLLTLAVVGVGTAAGLAATAANYRPEGPVRAALGGRAAGATAGATAAATAAAGLLLGAVLASVLSVANPDARATSGLSDAELAALPTFAMHEFRFEPAAIEARVGQTVAVRYMNAGSSPHAFDLDELDVHVPVPSGRTNEVLFTPTEPGTYVFYCGVPGHRDAGMTGMLVVRS